MTDNKKTENKTNAAITDNKEQKASSDIRKLADDDLEIVSGGYEFPTVPPPTVPRIIK